MELTIPPINRIEEDVANQDKLNTVGRTSIKVFIIFLNGLHHPVLQLRMVLRLTMADDPL